ncbi:MAG: hypothetical protein ACOCSK_03270 [Rhodothermales bacterium]
MRNIARFLAALYGTIGEESLRVPQKRLRLKKVRKYDPRVALQHRIEARVRKVANQRKRAGLPPEITEDEIRKWVKEEASRLGLELKEGGGDADIATPSSDD